VNFPIFPQYLYYICSIIHHHPVEAELNKEQWYLELLCNRTMHVSASTRSSLQQQDLSRVHVQKDQTFRYKKNLYEFLPDPLLKHFIPVQEIK